MLQFSPNQISKIHLRISAFLLLTTSFCLTASIAFGKPIEFPESRSRQNIIQKLLFEDSIFSNCFIKVLCFQNNSINFFTDRSTDRQRSIKESKNLFGAAEARTFQSNGLSATTAFTNSGSIAIPAANSAVSGGGAADPYSSDIAVSGLSGTISDLNVKINNFSHSYPDDVVMLLVAPTGENFILQSDVGGKSNVTDISYTFDDQAAASIGDSGPYPNNNAFVKPSSVGSNEILSAPAPPPPYNQPAPADVATLKSVFGGLNPNGTWKLFVFDFFAGNSGSIGGGWSLEITTTGNTVTSPSITNLNPTSQVTGGSSFQLTVNGGNFNSASVIRWNGQNKPTTFVSASQLTAQIPASDLQSAGQFPVTVFDPQTGKTSNAVNFSVANCSYSVNAATQTFKNSKASGSISISTTNGCAWTASSSASWITITSGSSGTGAGTVSFTVPQNTGYSRTGTITVGGQTVTINQDAVSNLFNISGVVSYGITTSGQNSISVPEVNFDAVGASTMSVMSDDSGFYQLSGLSAGNYTVTPQKTGDSNGINSQDAARIQQYLVGLIGFTANQLAAADVDDNGIVNSVDAARIQQYLVGIQSNNNIGQWKFLPANRQYNSLTTDLSNENYEAILVGEVSGNWTPTISTSTAENSEPEEELQFTTGAETDLITIEQKDEKLLLGNSMQLKNGQSEIAASRQTNIRSDLKSDEQKPNNSASSANLVIASLPANASSSPSTVVDIPVAVSDLTNTNIDGFNFTVFYDPNILSPVSGNAANNYGTLSDGCSVIGNSPAAGQLKVSGACVFPLNSGSGTLVNLRFNVVGTNNQRTDLLSNDPNVSGSPSTFQFNSGTPQATAIDGSFTVLAPTAASVSISGRVKTASGRGIRNVLVKMIDLQGNIRITRTSAFGYYHFNDVAAGSTYLLSAASKQYQFTMPTQVVNVSNELMDVDFTAQR